MGMPSEAGLELAYLSWLRDQYRFVDYVAALSGPTAEANNLPLAEIFVPQRVRAEPPPVKLPRELERRMLADRNFGARHVPVDEDREHIASKLREYADRPIRPLPEVLTGPEGERVVLLGYPGAGKSTLARYLALTLTDAVGCRAPDAAGVELKALCGYMPFVAPLRTYSKPARGERFVDVISRLASAGSELPILGVLETCLADQRALVIFDGLDEIFDVGLRDDAKERIRGFANYYPGVRVIVTSRVTDYARQELDKEPRAFKHHTIQDLNREEIALFARRFYGQICHGDVAERDRLVARLLDGVESSASIAELAGNPMLLTTLAFLGRSRDLPRNRLDTLKRTLELLVDGWDFARHLRKDPSAREAGAITQRHKLRLLRLIAKRILDGANGKVAANYLSADELAEEFREYFQRSFQMPEGDAENMAWQLLDQLRERDYILAKFESDAYGFVHRTFLDYLAAEEIFVRFSKHDMDRSAVFGQFRDHWRDPAWQPILPLLAGMLAELLDEESNEVFLALLDDDPLWYQDPNPLPRHVLLAIRCLGDVQDLNQLRSVSRAVATALTTLFEAVSERTDFASGIALAHDLEEEALPVLAAFGPEWAGRPVYENWYLTRGQFLRGERPGFAAAAAARIYVALLGRDDAARKRLKTLGRSAHPEMVRAAALEALAANWHDDPAVVALLCARAVDDPDWYVRRSAVLALAGYLAGDPGVRDLLRDRVELDPAPEVRCASVRVLADGWRGDADVAALLRSIGRDTSSGRQEAKVRGAAVQALAEGWHDDQDTLPWLWDRTAAEEDALVRAVAIHAIAEGWHDDQGVLSWLQQHSAADHEREPVVRAAAIRALAAGWPEETETVALIKTSAHEGGEDDLDVRLAAIEALAAGWHDDNVIVGWLRGRAADEPEPDVRYAVAEALAAYRKPGDERVTDLLQQRALKGTEEDPFVRAAVVAALARIKSGDQATGRWLRELLTETPNAWYVRRTAVRALAAGWSGDADTAEALKARAADAREDADVRGAAVLALTAGWHDRDTLGWLHSIGVLDWDARAEHVRRIATQAVAVGWHDDAQTLGWLRDRATGDPSPEVRRTALQLLAAGWHDDDATPGWLRERAVGDMRDGACEVRRAAIRTLSAGWRDDPETAVWLREHAFADEDPSVRLAVIATMASDWHDDPCTPGWLLDCARSKDDLDVSQAAADALSRGWPVA